MANFIPEEKISEILNAADIVDIVSEVLPLKKAGKDYVGLCPFHSEKTPSFTVSPVKQIFHCFGCGAGGNAVIFLMKHDGLSFPEAVRNLAIRYGIDIPSESGTPDQHRWMDERRQILEINQQAMAFFEKNLSYGIEAMAYLKRRKITDKTISDFHIGYVPDGWDHLYRHFSDKNISSELMVKAGLIIPKNSGGFYDRFRNRIMFPIIDDRNRVIAFGGRVMDDTQPKYLNTSETAVFNKGKTLYGINTAKRLCRETGTIFVVEGYVDVISLYQHGIENVVATLGTAMTQDHVRMLRRYADRVILVYDSDDAGIRAAVRSIDIFKMENIEARILVLPKGHDPDSYVHEFGGESFLYASESAFSAMSFLMDMAAKKYGLSTEGKVRIIADMAGPLMSINDGVARSLYVRELSERLNIPEELILKKIRETPEKNKTYKAVSQDNMPIKGDEHERHIIAMLLQFPDIRIDIEHNNALEYFEDKRLKAIGQAVLKKNGGQLTEIISSFDDEDDIRLISALAAMNISWDHKGCIGVIEQFLTSREKRLYQDNVKSITDESKLMELLDQRLRQAKERQSL